MLYIVPTPIGNLNDVTKRSEQVLHDCDLILAENPNHTRKLLSNLGVTGKKIIQLADHNEAVISKEMLSVLSTQNACLVSDAGTPSISDPGFKLIRLCRENEIEVVALPGASAVTTALSASGLPTDKFIFVGFLGKTEPKVLKVLEEAKLVEATLIAYESPHRITKTISLIHKAFPECKIVIARELTKMHEEYIAGAPEEVLAALTKKASIKGEITLLVSFK